MTTKELRELDAWIAENVMGWKVDYESARRKHGPGWLCQTRRNDNATWCRLPDFSVASSYAMDVLKKCADRLYEKDASIIICQHPVNDENDKSPLYWSVSHDHQLSESIAQTLELAIALFAKQLFSKTTT